MKLSTYLYDQTYYPAMPVVEVKLIAPYPGGSVGPLPSLIDTGADATLVPLDLLEMIEAKIVDSNRITPL